MNPEEYAETAAKLKRIVLDIDTIDRKLSEWYFLTQDDAPTKMFFRTVTKREHYRNSIITC